MIWALPLVGLIAFEVVADIFAKEYSLKGGPILWLSAIACYIICNSFWLYALKEGSGLARGGIIFSVATAITVVVLGLYFYHESLKPVQLLGIALGIASLVLIFWE
jgi:drug/metabolite transporter (DMT)-like permease